MKEVFEHSILKDWFFRIRMLIIKLIAPNFYEKAAKLGITKGFEERPYNIFPRPAIKQMKKLYGDKEIIGVEIGVLRGVNAESILKELNCYFLFLIDIWKDYKDSDLKYHTNEDYEITKKKFKNSQHVHLIKDYSHNAVNIFEDNSLDFVYIDGNHSFDYAYQDISQWYNKLKPNGIMGGHDIINHLGVLRALNKFCEEKKLEFKIDPPDFYLIKYVQGGKIDFYPENLEPFEEEEF